MIDYGATKRLRRSERLGACVLYCALARGDEDMLVTIAIEGGYKSRHFNRQVGMAGRGRGRSGSKGLNGGRAGGLG